MYCGCNPIARASQLQVSRALTRLLGQKSYASVTVSELCREAGISRQTFYSLFSSMENVLLFTLREQACALLSPRGEDALSLEQLCRDYSRYLCENRAFLKLLVENDVGYLLYHGLYDAFTHCAECGGGDGSGPEGRYAAHFLAGGLMGIVQQYCATDPPVGPEELFQILYRLLRGAWCSDWDLLELT